MKKSVKKGIVILLGIALSGICVYILWYISNTPNYYEYPINDTMDAGTILNECRIPEATLETMTDEELAQAVADFPLLIDVLTAYSIEYGVECLANESDAYKELLSRENGKQAMIAKVVELQEREDTEEIKIQVEILKKIILNEPLFKTDLTESEKEILLAE